MSNVLNSSRQYVMVVEQAFDFQDLATANLLASLKAKFKPKLPANAIPLRGQIIVSTAFNGTTPTVAVTGETSTATYVAAASLSAVGVVALTVTPSKLLTGDVVAFAPNAGAQASTAGSATLIMEYLISGRGHEANP